MEWTDEQLLELKKFGAAFFSVKKTAICMQLHEKDLADELRNDKSEGYAAYYSGFYESEAKVNKAIIDLAINGSSPAQMQAIKLMDYCQNENKL